VVDDSINIMTVQTQSETWITLLLARLMGQYCFARWHLLSVVVCQGL